MMVNIKDTEKMDAGFYSWCWNVLDRQTKFVLASEIKAQRDSRRKTGACGREREANGQQPS